MKKRLFSMLIVIFSVFMLASCSLELRAVDPYTSPIAYEQLRIDMIEEVMPSVVAIKTETGHGSGIIYKSESLESGLTRYSILTNFHVIEDGGEMKVHFGGAIDDIAVVEFAGNQTYDIAVVRIETTQVLRVHDVASINDNTVTEIKVGQDVYAIGTPQDIDKFNYVTQGIVSMVSYPYNGIPGLVLMHDAELNPGNSGGPLFNLNGELIGINVAKVASIETIDGAIAAEGLNYSLSINKIAPIIRGFDETDFEIVVRKPRLGVTIQEINFFLEENDASLLPENPVGVVVIDFDLTRNAHLVLQVNDLIIAMNGTPVTSKADIIAQLVDAEFGDSHVLKVMRFNGTTFVEVTVTIVLS